MIKKLPKNLKKLKINLTDNVFGVNPEEMKLFSESLNSLQKIGLEKLELNFFANIIGSNKENL